MKQSSTSSSNYKKYTSSNPLQKLLITRYYKNLHKLIPQGIKTVLDVGCGEGFLLRYLPPLTQYVGVDYNEDSLYLAENSKFQAPNSKQIQNIKFQKENVYSLSLENKQFDLVFCLEVLEHLKNYEKALREIKRVAKKWVILSVPNEPWFQLSNFLRGKYLSSWGNHPEHINKWSPTQFSTIVNKYFTIKKTKYSFPWQILLCNV